MFASTVGCVIPAQMRVQVHLILAIDLGQSQSTLLPLPHTGKPTDSGICLQAVKELGPDFPVFGVCMGLQCIGEAFGGERASVNLVMMLAFSDRIAVPYS